MSFALEINNVLEFKFYCNEQGQYSINTRHYRVIEVNGTGETDVNATLKVSTSLATAFKGCVGNTAQFLGVSGQIIRSIRRPKSLITAQADVGDFAGEQLPRQVCGLITLLTDEASRHGRGRMYMPFPTEAANTSLGVPSGEYVDALNNLALLLDDTLTVGTAPNTVKIQPVIYNRATHAVIPITSARAAGVWATQRRRSDIRGGDRPPF